MFFPCSLSVSGFSTSYTFTRVTQLVLISQQLVVRNLLVAKKKKKTQKNFFLIHEALYKVAPAEHPIKCVSGQSLSHKKRRKPNKWFFNQQKKSLPREAPWRSEQSKRQASILNTLDLLWMEKKFVHVGLTNGEISHDETKYNTCQQREEGTHCRWWTI